MIFTFAEHILLFGIENHPIAPQLPVVFFEILEKERDPKCPIRIRGSINLSSPPSDGNCA
jgi:hypothetical protein